MNESLSDGFRLLPNQVSPSEKKIHRQSCLHTMLPVAVRHNRLSAQFPSQQNCGLSQGRLVRRGKIAKRTGEFYSWKDFNVGCEVELNGIVFHTTDCDDFTREFLTANGIEVNERECMPKDPVSIDK